MLYKRGRIWWTEFEHAGTRHRLSTGETDPRSAAAKARRLRVEVEDKTGPGGRQVGAGLALEVLETLDLERVEQMGLGEDREQTIGELWAPLLRELGPQRDVTTLTLADVDAYEGKRRASVRGQTIRREVGALVRGLRLAKRSGAIRAMPFDPDDLREIASDPPLPSQQAKEWSALEIAKVLSKLSRKAVTAGIRDQMRLIQLTGLRFTELKRVRWSWVNRSALVVPAIAGSKTKKPREVPLTKEALGILKKWRHKEGDEPLFAHGKPNLALKSASRRAKMPAVLTPRDLRAFFITHAGRNDPRSAQALAGHTSISTTSRYLHADKQRILRAARLAADAAVPTRRSPQKNRPRRKA